ncbi:GxxExxY protein [Kaistella daneshvariae]|uniref:GxxExxY protein n=1 Tax=Kaistella daneshvariae TaxID=2487074 RepID=A0ABN5SWM3_9FLAO|nr:GxxExxY protein [Kaistella daneshvariae]AZI66669.1 GxxExxY protein [Kaistella daneshvariae]
MITQSYLTDLTYKINGACIEVHKILGPGLLEKVYHEALLEEFSLQGIKFKSEHFVEVNYKGKKLNCDYKCDFLIEDVIVLEIKSVKALDDIHRAKLLNYMNLLKVPKGILINFNVKNIYHEGQETFVNEFYKKLF